MQFSSEYRVRPILTQTVGSVATAVANQALLVQ